MHKGGDINCMAIDSGLKSFVKKEFGGFMKVLFSFISLCFFAVLATSNVVMAKELSSRLGVGFRNSYAIDVPSIATIYYPSSSWGIVGGLGVDTQTNNSKFVVSGGLRKIVFTEDNMNYFMGGQISLLSQQTATTSNSGYELGVLAGGEFFLPGLENLGFNFECGIAVTSLASVQFRTFGDSFLRSGIIFYF